ncbi:MFS transporter [Streptomyces sp. NPDC002386]
MDVPGRPGGPRILRPRPVLTVLNPLGGVSPIFAGPRRAAELIAARVGQGVAAALLVPATLGLLSSAYPAGAERDRAVAVWGTTGAVGLALGVTAGGGILAVASWQWIYWINLPIVAVCLLAAGNALRATTAGERAPIAVAATLSACTAVVAVVLAFTELSRARPALPVVATALAVTVLAGGLLAFSQKRRRPLAPRALLGVRTLRTACLVAALYMASFGAEFYLVTLYLQEVRDYSALAAGMAFLPLAGTITVGNTVAGRLAGRVPLRRLLSMAFLTGAAGLLVLALAVGAEGGYVPGILPGLLLSGLGQGMAFTAMFITGTRDLPQASNATGSALVTTAPTAGDFVLAFCVTAVIAAAAAPSVLILLNRTGRQPDSPTHREQPLLSVQQDQQGQADGAAGVLESLHAPGALPDTVRVASSGDPAVIERMAEVTAVANLPEQRDADRGRCLRALLDIYGMLPVQARDRASLPETTVIAPEREGRILAESLGVLPGKAPGQADAGGRRPARGPRRVAALAGGPTGRRRRSRGRSWRSPTSWSSTVVSTGASVLRGRRPHPALWVTTLVLIASVLLQYLSL